MLLAFMQEVFLVEYLSYLNVCWKNSNEAGMSFIQNIIVEYYFSDKCINSSKVIILKSMLEFSYLLEKGRIYQCSFRVILSSSPPHPPTSPLLHPDPVCCMSKSIHWVTLSEYCRHGNCQLYKTSSLFTQI